jgi:ParB family transcriptional regulator, chromosome partitioning protein
VNRQRGLGRGLGALFPTATAEEAPRGARSQLDHIEVERIRPNPHQPRRHFDEESLTALASSIRTHGVLAPIIVRRHPDVPDAYEIVTGERRWRAARLAGQATIPSIIRETRADEAIELAILENVQRTDLNPIEEAAGYRALVEKHGFTQEMIAQRIGKSRPTVTNAMRLLALPDSVQALIRDGKLSAGHGRALAALPQARAHALATEALRHQWSVRDIERKAAEPKERKTSSTGGSSKTLSPEMAEAENRLRFALATRVALHPRAGGGGTIEVHYADDGELTRILDRVAPQDI